MSTTKKSQKKAVQKSTNKSPHASMKTEYKIALGAVGVVMLAAFANIVFVLLPVYGAVDNSSLSDASQTLSTAKTTSDVLIAVTALAVLVASVAGLLGTRKDAESKNPKKQS